MSKDKISRFERRFQEIANHIPLGILDKLHKRKRHPTYIPGSFNKVVAEAQTAFPNDILLVLQNVVYASESRKEGMKLTISSDDCERLLDWFVEWFVDEQRKDKQI